MPVPAIIAGVATVGGAILSSSAQKKAASQAANAATQTAETNNALQRDIYGQNAAALRPFQVRGNEAGNAINALLGLGYPQEQAQGNALSLPGYGGGYTGGGSFSGGGRGGFGQYGYENQAGDFGGFTAQQTPFAQTAQPAPSTPQADYNKAFQNYQNSTGFQFRLGEGIRAIDAGAPVRNSGATLKARQAYGQNLASNEFGNYLGQLGNQQSVGLSGASAQAGVGQNYANAVSNNNNSAGTAQANAALLRGNANQQLFGGIANGLGSIFGSSFGR